MNMNEQQLDELLGAYALNAIDTIEREQIDSYLERSPRAAAEVADHLYVAAALAGSISEVPAPSFDRISAAIDLAEQQPVRQSENMLPDDTAATMSESHDGARVIPMRRRKPIGTWLGAVAATAAIGVLGFHNIQTGRQLDDSKSNLAAQTEQRQALTSQLKASQQEAERSLSVQRVMASPGVRVAPLTHDSQPIGRVLLDSNGRGFLELTAGQVLETGKAFQLWGVQDKKVISLGVMKAGLNEMPLSAAGEWSQFVLTVESLPGVVASDGPAVAEGTFSF
jgi:anti-sigma-K factor RskA